MKKINICLIFIHFMIFTANSLAATEAVPFFTSSETYTTKDVVDHRKQQEHKQLHNPFTISLYRTLYFLPYYYSSDPDYAVYAGHTPAHQPIQNREAKFQISFKIPIFSHLLNKSNILYLGYTQQSYWQIYNASPFFRETNYEPELFLSNSIDLPLLGQLKLNTINIGASHQSNGRGDTLERTWNRLYVETILSNTNWMVSIKPWYIFNDSALRTHNPDIGKYLGYSQTLVAYKFHNQTFAIEARNILESNFKRGAVQLTWSFPLVKSLKGYVQIFSGFGQSLIEYNHYTNSAGIGIAVSDWI
jgi:phospholipase A1